MTSCYNFVSLINPKSQIMKTVLKCICTLILLCNFLSSYGQKSSSTVIPNQYIIFIQDDFSLPTTKMKNHARAKTREARAEMFKTNSTTLRTKLEAALRKGGLKEYKLLNVVSGANNIASIKLNSSKDMSLLKKFKFIKHIEKDRKFRGVMKGFENFKPSGQEVDWGIPAVGAQNSSGVGKCAFVVDTGIFGNHPDLNVNKPLSTSFVPSEPGLKDNNGHGTHVAGIIAAKDNLIGVKGVAAGATIIGVKVLNTAGTGSWSQLISGNSYVLTIGFPGDAVNYSLSGPISGASAATISTLTSQYNSMSSAGMFVVFAAGNNNANASGFLPSNLNGPNIYTVSAYDSGFNIASFSNFGNAPIDFAAPGVDVKSCDIKKNGYYSTKSGTSMAAPYVAGILLVNGGVVNSAGPVASDKDATLDLKARL